MKKVLLFAFSYLAVNVAVAQSDKQLTHYMFDKMSFNPAITGFDGYCATVIYRGQWDKVENAPNTFLFNAQGALPNINSGVGISFMQDVVGLGKETDLKLNYAFHKEVPGAGYLSAGIGLGIENIGFDPKWNAPITGTDISLDPNLPQGASETGLDFNFGLHFKGKERYFVGLSATHLTQPTLTNVSYTKARHYYVLAGFEITNRFSWAYFLPNQMTVTPSFLYKTDATEGVLDFNIMADMWMGNGNAGFYGGLTYRTKDAFAILVGFQMKQHTRSSVTGGNPDRGTLKAKKQDAFKVGYSYDIMTNPLKQYGGGSHEIVFNYCMFKPQPKVQRYGNVFILQ